MRFHLILPNFNPISTIFEFLKWFRTLSIYWLVKSYDFTNQLAILTTLLLCIPLPLSLVFKPPFLVLTSLKPCHDRWKSRYGQQAKTFRCSASRGSFTRRRSMARIKVWSWDLASLKPPINTNSMATMKKGPKGKKTKKHQREKKNTKDPCPTTTHKPSTTRRVQPPIFNYPSHNKNHRNYHQKKRKNLNQ